MYRMSAWEKALMELMDRRIYGCQVRKSPADLFAEECQRVQVRWREKEERKKYEAERDPFSIISTPIHKVIPLQATPITSFPDWMMQRN